jgi:hypothetical protein
MAVKTVKTLRNRNKTPYDLGFHIPNISDEIISETQISAKFLTTVPTKILPFPNLMN